MVKFDLKFDLIDVCPNYEFIVFSVCFLHFFLKCQISYGVFESFFFRDRKEKRKEMDRKRVKY